MRVALLELTGLDDRGVRLNNLSQTLEVKLLEVEWSYAIFSMISFNVTTVYLEYCVRAD